MTLAKKQPEEQAKEFERELQRRISEELKEPSYVTTLTRFGRRKDEMQLVCTKLMERKRLIESKDSDGIIRINEIGPGFERGVYKGFMEPDVLYEPYELLNQARNAGINSKHIILYVSDMVLNPLLFLKQNRFIKMPEGVEKDEYFRNFFPGSHIKNDKIMLVEIPEEWRKRIVCFQIDISKQPVPVKAHITYSYIPLMHKDDEPRYLENLVTSTMKGGYIFSAPSRSGDEILKDLGALPIRSRRYPTIYQLE